MPLTPADVHNIAFSKPSIGKRGYDEEEVDAFLDSLEQELVRLIEENHRLRALAAREPAGVDPRLAEAVDEAAADLGRAQRAARAMEAELHEARSARRGPDRPAVSPQVLTMAERSADSHVGEARRAADDLLSEARATARHITDEALAAAATLDLDARRRHQEAIDAVDAERAATLAQIEELEALGGQYRALLRGHVESEMRRLGGREAP
ncbi:DivIVA domain-containing protein [Asanoa sp. WMMD1127]|uniref:DivIVA domain-containing protein n=1 Tax=Asanoa sp. WMMD1127 TaxID=3016107 RepID=UPI0024174608|nr:DivIVA domain-containing protein [Asanoa sp. WMMD1127]MDG4824647.1 DivIVA domain-containing protein [Asanoa sp. WMMD1127]